MSINLSQFQSIEQTRSEYNKLYKIVAGKKPRYIHYALLRIAGQTRKEAHIGAGYKPQGKSKSGADLQSTNAIHIEKGFPIILDFISIGKHLNMLKMLEEQKERIMSPEERMIMLSDIARGEIHDVKHIKVERMRKGKKVSKIQEVHEKPIIRDRMKAIDGMNKMDGSYKTEIVIKESESTKMENLTTSELNEMLSKLESIV